MNWFLCICFTILVVCIVIQTIYCHKTLKICDKQVELECSDENEFIRIFVNDDNKTIFVAKDTIVSFALIELPENTYNVVINCIDTHNYIEEYSYEDEAWKRIDELLETLQ